ncbi:MAG TPA: retropepsin-like aspartic protease, partial [Terriglobia bacterium]|nr:retropepsin-like aspartic protease [Terriglobia bacterium]
MDVEITDGRRKDWTVTRGLLDSGSQGSCVNKALSTDALTDHREKATPTTMIIADGHDSPAGPIIQYNSVKIRIAGQEEQLALDTASLSHPIILGMPWHKRHNPKIDYPRNTMTFDSEYCRKHCHHYGRTVPLHPKDSEMQTSEKTETPTP